MSRFTDYSIDYDAGTLIFREPIFSRDEHFNPILIVVEYEAVSEGGDDYTYGGRAGVKLMDNKLKAGASYIHEGQNERDGDLYGMDTTLKLNEKRPSAENLPEANCLPVLTAGGEALI